MNIELDEATHTYSVDGEIASISVTELLHKHGLAPDYSGVPSETLKEAAARGKAIHKDIADFVNTDDHESQTDECRSFSKWMDDNADCAVAEMPLAFEYSGMLVAGTADLIGIMKNGEVFIADHKNTKTFQREYVSWQVSILDYFMRKIAGAGLKVNGHDIVRLRGGASKFFCFHYTDGKCEPKALDKIPDEEIERLLACELVGKIYQRAVLSVAPETQAEIEQAELYLSRLKKFYDDAESKVKELRAQLCEEMRRQGIKSWETDKVKVTYVAPVERSTADTAKLKKNYPQAFTECQKITKVKDTVRVTIRGNEDEE